MTPYTYQNGVYGALAGGLQNFFDGRSDFTGPVMQPYMIEGESGPTSIGSPMLSQQAIDYLRDKGYTVGTSSQGKNEFVDVLDPQGQSLYRQQYQTSTSPLQDMVKGATFVGGAMLGGQALGGLLGAGGAASGAAGAAGSAGSLGGTLGADIGFGGLTGAAADGAALGFSGSGFGAMGSPLAASAATMGGPVTFSGAAGGLLGSAAPLFGASVGGASTASTGSTPTATGGGVMDTIKGAVGPIATWAKDNPLLARLLFSGAGALLGASGGASGGGGPAPFVGTPTPWSSGMQMGIQAPVQLNNFGPVRPRAQGMSMTGAGRFLKG